MAESGFDVAVNLQMSLGESPVWSVERQTLYWVDINRGRIYAWQPASDTLPAGIDFDAKIGCIALCEDGLLAALSPGIERLTFPLGSRREPVVENPEWHDGEGNRFNDGRCDPAGRLWVGTLAVDESKPSATLYCLEDGRLVPCRSDVTIANGLAFSPDRRWLYHTDSPTRRIMRYAFDASTGGMGEPEPWVDLDAHDLPGVPDGAAVDSEGNYWCALYGGAQVAKFAEDGRWLQSYSLPCPDPTMVAFGGSDLKTLYVTTATQHLDEAGLARYPLAGSVFSMRVTSPGLPEPIVAL